MEAELTKSNKSLRRNHHLDRKADLLINHSPSGDPNTLLAALYQRYDHSRSVALVNRLLGTNF